MSTVAAPGDRTLTDQVVRIVRKKIILGDYPSGTRLIELQLAEQFDVSRSTIREAFRRLEAESLIETSPHRGTRVASIAAADAIEVCALHALLESEIVRKLELPVSDEMHESLLDYVDQMAGLSFPEDVDLFIEIDHQFHHTLVSAVSLRRFEQVWTSMNSLIGLLVAIHVRHIGIMSTETAARHQAIVDAVRQPNHDVAATVVAEHYRSMGERATVSMRMQLAGQTSE